MTNSATNPATNSSSTPKTRTRRDPVVVGMNVWAVLVFIFLFLPILVIVVYSFNNGRLLGSWDSFGFEAFTRAWDNAVIRRAVQVSILSALGAAVVATTIGTLAGIGLARSTNRKAALVLTAMLSMTLVTPEIIDAVATLPWFVRLGTDLGFAPINNGMVRLVVAHTTVSVAVVTFIVRARMQGMDVALENAAADLYATPWNRFRQITLPLAAPGIIAGALMAFTLSLDNTIVSSFIQVPGYTPWPVYIFGSLRVGLRPEVAAVSTVLLVLTLFALAVVAFVLRRLGQSSSDVAKTLAG